MPVPPASGSAACCRRWPAGRSSRLRQAGELVGDSRHVDLDRLPQLPRVESHFRRLLGHEQVTDAHLVALAETAGASLLTLDRRILPPASPRGLVEVITP
jgi:predicted nucleic acid-binding protein